MLLNQFGFSSHQDLILIIGLFLAVCILFYSLFAGADFGGGILELLRGPVLRKEQAELINKAISPVWEANHVWLILAIVVLFVGFPVGYARISTIYHIPLTIMLIGIILRGCAFTFRHYDAVKDDSQKYYSVIFVLSSFVTPIMLGTIAGALFLGRRVQVKGTFAETYVSPWLNLFSFSVGFFATALFAFLAAVYMIGESPNPDLRRIFTRRARTINAVAMACGLFVFIAAEIDDLHLLRLFLSDRFACICLVLATLILPPLWYGLKRRYARRCRFLVAGQVGLILLGWFQLQFPALLISRDPSVPSLTIFDAAAPEVTLRPLLGALIFGCLLIFPALYYLLRIFKTPSAVAPRD